MGCSPGNHAAVPASTAGAIHNGLNFNSIVFNRNVFSGLSARPIATGRTPDGKLIFNTIEGVETTPEGRELLHYVAQCALDPEDTLLVESDGEEHEFPGLFALAPGWEYRDIDATEKELISACLLAHVNAYGLLVFISVRVPGAITADPAEIASHPVYEGTFFGDLFGADIDAFACTGSVREIAVAHSEDRSLRACADPTPDCQLTVVGRCRDVCDTYSDKYGWQGCHGGGRRYEQTVSVFLHDDNADGLNRTCGAGKSCSFLTMAGDSVIDCSDARSCTTTCMSGSYCTVESNSASRSQAVVMGRSMSEINCQLAGTCAATCMGDSDCDIDCWNAGSCRQNICMGGAGCLLNCAGAASCGFSFCAGTVTQCANDVLVCNRACP